MRTWLLGFLLALASMAQAGEASGEKTAMIYGKPDGAVPGWSIVTLVPQGWTQDCCQYAKAIGVNLVLYRGEWTGEPNRVMVLNVWPQKLPTLAAEWQDDKKHYLQRDPAAKVSAFAVNNPKMACQGGLYQGTDHMDDVVVFCDPGKAAGIHLSWSMTVAANDASRGEVLERFKRVVEQSIYMKYEPGHRPADATKR
ncbi:hypothetical protein [Dyella subtropica]|uniref:hypothetical protein n=1 Tax=Dyella subtropica TaxID=2992127 RepID=UPI002255909C|nr:hypothetical protein [Dyella subtropica]